MTSKEYDLTLKGIRNAEQIVMFEQRLVVYLKERILSENFGFSDAPNEQSVKKLEEGISAIADIFLKIKCPWFIGGGIALELHRGYFYRNHGDYDVFLYEENFYEVLESIRKSDYEVFYFVPDEKITIATETQIHAEVHFHLKKVNKDISGPEYIDLWILRREEERGDIIWWDKKMNIFLPRNSFENASHYTENNGREVSLLPKEVLILNKIFGERQFDFRDLKIFLPTLSTGEKQQLHKYLESAGATFVIDDKETENLDELLRLIEITIKDKKENLLVPKIGEVISKNRKRFSATALKDVEISELTDAEIFNLSQYFLKDLKREARDMTCWKVHTHSNF